MTALVAWGSAALVASAALMVLVLALRIRVRQWIGPRLGFALWAMPAVRLILPPLPPNLFDAMPLAERTAAGMQVLVSGSRGAVGFWPAMRSSWISEALLMTWLVGAICLFIIYAARHFFFCRRLCATGTDFGQMGTIRIIAADVRAPLAFGMFKRFVAVPYEFAKDYDAGERDLALAHEHAHHARYDLAANWASIIVLAMHWWNPIAWVAIRAFREDQELAADAHVLAARGPGARTSYAHVLAKAAGVGVLPACNLNARSNLKGRLIMLGQNQQTSHRLAIGGVALMLFGGATLAATATISGATVAAAGRQAVTMGVKPDGSGKYALIIGDAIIAPSMSLPRGMTLPPDFSGAGGCDLKPTAKPFAMVIKGTGKTQTYTVMCASAAPAPLRKTLAEGLSSLTTMRASVATQPATTAFPEAERAHALAAIDRSVREVEATIAAIG